MIASINSKAFQSWFAAAGASLRKNVASALQRTSVAAATYAKLSKLYKSHTYGLRKSIRHQLVNEFHSKVSANAKYAGWVEDGTQPHPIRARRKKALRFVQNGAVTFRKSVFHPGTKPRPFMKEAQEKATPLFDRLCNEAADRSFK